MERMRDEMKWMEVEYTKDGLQKYSVSIRHQKIGKMQNGLEHEHSPNATATGTTLNNYYINAINYNNIINHHSNVNLQNMAQNVRWNPLHSTSPNPPNPPNSSDPATPSTTSKQSEYEKKSESPSTTNRLPNRASDVLSAASLSLSLLEKQCMAQKRELDEKTESVSKQRVEVQQQKEALDAERATMEMERRELERNARRLRMERHRFEIAKHHDIDHRLMAVTESMDSLHSESKESDSTKCSDPNDESAEQRDIGKFSKIELNAMRQRVCEQRRRRQQKMSDLTRGQQQLEYRISGIELNFKKWLETQNMERLKTSEEIHSAVDSFIEHRKRSNGMMRRFDTKQFDPIRLHQELILDIAEVEREEEAETPITPDPDPEDDPVNQQEDSPESIESEADGLEDGQKRKKGHHTSFSFERYVESCGDIVSALYIFHWLFRGEMD